MLSDFRTQALLQGRQLPDSGNGDDSDTPSVSLTAEQEAQADAQLKKSIQRKIMEKRNG